MPRYTKPAALKIIDGGADHSPINLSAEDDRALGPPPDSLTEAETAIWYRTANEWRLLLTAQDRAAFTIVCKQLALRDVLEAEVAENGRYSVTESGRSVLSAAYRALQDLDREIMRAFNSFGATPGTRGRVQGDRKLPYSKAQKGGLELLTWGGLDGG